MTRDTASAPRRRIIGLQPLLVTGCVTYEHWRCSSSPSPLSIPLSGASAGKWVKLELVTFPTRPRDSSDDRVSVEPDQRPAGRGQFNQHSQVCLGKLGTVEQ